MLFVLKRVAVTLCLISLSVACKSRQFNSETTSAEDTEESEATGGLSDSEKSLLAKYDNAQALYDDLKENKKQRILERFLIPMTNLESLILKYTDGKSTEESIPALASAFQKNQFDFSRFQTLIEIYQKFDNYKDIFEPFYQKSKSKYNPSYGIKEINDSIEALAKAEMNHAFAIKVNAPSQIITQLKINRDEKYASFIPIISKDWMPDKYQRIPFFVKFLDSLRSKKHQEALLENKEDRVEVIEQFKSRLKEFSLLKLDYDSLELGFNELRRNLRWITLGIVSFNGLISPSKDVPSTQVKNYEDTLNYTELEKGYWIEGLKNFRRPSHKYPISISLYQSAVYYQEIMGEIKNAWQNFDAIHREYLSTNLAKNKEEAHKLTLALLNEAGVRPVAYKAEEARSLTIKEGVVAPLTPLMDFSSMGRAIDAIVKNKETSLFNMVRDQLNISAELKSQLKK